MIAAFAILLAAAAQPDLRFHAAAGGAFDFDTGVLRGTLRAGGKSVGLSTVVHIPSGKTITKGNGLFGHYRVFSANHRYTDGWGTASEAKLNPDGSVEAHWPAAENRPFEMWAVYRWADPATLDVETRVRAQKDLTGFESFLASYFADSFSSSSVCIRKQAPAFAAADEAGGAWQMFPRDQRAVAVIGDGRWKYPPSPVDWRILPKLAHALSVRRDPESGIAAVLMSPLNDCFAVSTPIQTDGHHSLYLSLFGRNIKAGKTLRATSRFTIGSGLKEAEILSLYRTYIGNRTKGLTPGRHSAGRPASP